MKYKIQLTIISLFCICTAHKIFAQSADGIVIVKTDELKQLLSLSENQHNSVNSAYNKMFDNTTSLQTLNLNPEERATRLTQISIGYHTALKSVLTAEQWDTYKAACEKTEKIVEQHLQKQKIRYTFLKTQ